MRKSPSVLNGTAPLSRVNSDSWLEIAWPVKEHPKVVPFFLPYLGCNNHCIFCAQEVQTGTSAINNYLIFAERLTGLEMELRKRLKIGQTPPELAFYGGTFTALPAKYWELALNFAKGFLDHGLISAWRCSTRPDALADERIQALKDAGCYLVELGIQSFSDLSLAVSGRGYQGEDAYKAIGWLQRSGLKAGVQLLPGMPGSTPEGFLQDVKKAIGAGAACLRYYPCLVIAGSGLASLWEKGEYRPWELQETLDSLAAGWLLALEAGVPVIRMGLSPEPGLEDAVLAGPRHECLGSRVMGRALLRLAEARVPACSRLALWLPPALHGCIWGWRGELRRMWKIGLEVNYWKKNILRLEWDNLA